MFDLSDQEMVQEGITTKEQVLKFMGSPTFISDLDDDEAWVYYSEDVKRLLFFLPKIMEREILVVRFNNDQTVKELKRISLNHESKDLSFVTDHTKVESHKTGFFKSIFGNIGQVKPQ
jgi:outer membrane protein assembly factor BamE (lipoprotein component of BamABCDE complex)